MTRQTKWRILLTLAAAVGGCADLTDKDGKRVSLNQYDCVIVDQVTIASQIPHPEMAECLRPSLELELLAGDRWLKAREVDVRMLLSAAGRDDPFDPNSPRSDPWRLREQDKWEKHLTKPIGSRPVLLRAEITKVHFPSWRSMTVLGSTSYAYCRISLFDPGQAEPLGTARVFSAPELPRLGVWNTALAGVLTNVIRHKEYKREDRLLLARDVAKQIVRTLRRTKGRRAPGTAPDRAEPTKRP